MNRDSMTINSLHIATAIQIAAVWKAAAKSPRGHARNVIFWTCVNALQRKGFAGSARRFLESAAAWY